jgi:hypothetical protein
VVNYTFVILQFIELLLFKVYRYTFIIFLVIVEKVIWWFIWIFVTRRRDILVNGLLVLLMI